MALSFQGLMIQLFKRLPASMLYAMAGGKPMQIDGHTLNPMSQLLWVQGKKQPPLRSFPPPVARAGAAAGLGLLKAAPRPMANIENTVIPAAGRDIPIRVYTPRGVATPSALTLYFHQGGCVIGDLDTCDAFCTQLADTAKCRLISVDYRLAPEHKFPAAVDDAIAAYEWALANAAELRIDRKRIAVAGDSAGGQLSAVITHHARKNALQMPAFQLLIYPWLEGQADTPSYSTMTDAYPLDAATMKWFCDLYLNDASELADMRVSPLRETSFAGLPPAFIASAGFDPLRDEAKLYADKLQAAGVPATYKCYGNLTHSFAMISGAVPAAVPACNELADALKNALAGHVSSVPLN